MTTTAPELLREQVAIMLAAENFRAKRVIPRGRKFADDPPTAYDIHHEHINELITQLVGH